MKNLSSLHNIHKEGLFGDHEKNNPIKIKEIKDVLVYQVVKYKNSKINNKDIVIDNLNFLK